MRDLHNNITVLNALNNASIASSTTTSGPIIPLSGYEAAEFVIKSGVITDGTYTPVLTVGDDSALADGAAAPAGDLIGTLAAAVLLLTDDQAIKNFGYKGPKKYARLDIVSTGVTTGGALSAIAILSHAHHKPAGATQTP